MLSIKNTHERDAHITMDETHTYYINGENNYTSVTTIINRQFTPFNADHAIHLLMNGSKWNSNNQYWGLTPTQIKEKWDMLRDESCHLGTQLHYNIEMFLNQKPHTTTIEFNYFLQFLQSHPIVPYRTEWKIYNEEYKIAGTIDLLVDNENGTYSLYDWKRVKEIKMTSFFRTYSTTIPHILDTNYWHYCLQLNMYKFILESTYGKHISHMYLIQLHPLLHTYKIIECPSLQQEITNINHFIL